jgi:hypothetical protein
MILSLLSILVALLLAFGAAKELWVRGVEGGEIQPFIIGLVGIAVSIMLATSGIALWRRWPRTWQILMVAGLSSVLFHVYAALPPHRYVGMFALLLGAGFGLILIGVSFTSGLRKAEVN